MWFVLVIAIVAIAGWIFLANSDKVTRTGDAGADERMPANPYENPYDTHENNDRPFAPDNGDAASDDCSSDTSDSSDGCDSSDTSSD